MKKHCDQKKLETSHASQILTHEPQILVLYNSYLITTVFLSKKQKA